MSTIGFVVHPERAEAAELAAVAVAGLVGAGHQARVLDQDPTADLSGLDLVVSLGGDGTMLRSAALAGPFGVPVLGVNLGRLGYLTVVEPGGLADALQRFIAGDYQVEARMTIDVAVVTVDGGPASCDQGEISLRTTALNDVILQRPGGSHTIRVGLAVNGRPFVTYAADSVIVATPTGSTAYNLSARGPIASPSARVQIVTPVAPHSLFDRPLILDARERVAVGPADDGPADLVVDGQGLGVVKPGEVVRCCAGAHDAQFVTFGGRDFQDILKRKFNLGLP